MKKYTLALVYLGLDILNAIYTVLAIIIYPMDLFNRNYMLLQNIELCIAIPCIISAVIISIVYFIMFLVKLIGKKEWLSSLLNTIFFFIFPFIFLLELLIESAFTIGMSV